MTPSLLLTAFLSTASADGGGWDAEARQVVTADFGVELALERVGSQPRDASALYGATTLGSTVNGAPVRVSAVGWLRLDGVTMVDPLKTRGTAQRRHCARLEGHDPVPGGREVVPLRPTLDGATADTPPTVVLANGNEGEFAIVQLLPGDKVAVTDVQHRGKAWEFIEVSRGSQRLTVARRGNGAEVCYEPDIHMRAEWLPD